MATVTTQGLNNIGALLRAAGAAATAYAYNRIGIGDGTTVTEGAAVTAFSNCLARSAALTPAGTNATYSLTNTFGAGVGTGNITEYGIVGSATLTTADVQMYHREAATNKAAGDSLQVTLSMTAT